MLLVEDAILDGGAVAVLESVASNKGHDGAGGFERDTVVRDRRAVSPCPHQIEAVLSRLYRRRLRLSRAQFESAR